MAGRHRKPPSKGGQGRHRRPPERRRLVAPALGTIVLLGAGGVAAAAAITGGGGTGRTPDVVASTTTAPATVAPSPTQPTAVPQPSATEPEHRRPAAALAIRTTGAVSWVEVTRPGGRLVFSGLLRHGHAVVVRRGPAHAVIGDAGAVRLSRHGRVSEPAGRPHQVLVVDVR
jgi:hypothetical protein